MAAVTDPKWDTLPGVLEITSFDAATNTLVGKNPTEVQTSVNTLTQGAQAVLKSNAYVHSATVKGIVTDVIILAHLYPEISTVLPVPSGEVQRKRKAALKAVRQS